MDFEYDEILGQRYKMCAVYAFSNKTSEMKQNNK